MATAAFPNTDTALPLPTPLDDRHGWGFALLLAVVATLFLRPADLIPALDAWPIYQFLIICCLVVSFRATLRQLTQKGLGEQPVTVCLFVLLVAVGASHLSHGFLWAARMSMYEVSKLVVFYLLITGLVNTPQRLDFFVRWLTLAITIVAALTLLDRAGVISIAALESIQSRSINEADKTVLIDRIRGTGIFQDPNDFGLILVTGLTLSASFIFRPGAGWPRYMWLLPSLVLLAALAFTHSRGAFVSLACVFPVAMVYRRGWKIGTVSLLVLPLLVIIFSGRMTDFTAINAGTGQSRIQIWSDSLTVFREYPLFGLGEGMLVERLGVVAHNSFLHCYAELGIFGGAAFTACFLATALGLWSRRDKDPGPVLDQRHGKPRTTLRSGPRNELRTTRELAHLRVFVFAALAAYSAGMLTLSRQFVTPTYLILGLATAAQSLHGAELERPRITKHFLPLVLLVSAALLLFFYSLVRIFVRW